MKYVHTHIKSVAIDLLFNRMAVHVTHCQWWIMPFGVVN